MIKLYIFIYLFNSKYISLYLKLYFSGVFLQMQSKFFLAGY